jgi:hypothetical protein
MGELSPSHERSLRFVGLFGLRLRLLHRMKERLDENRLLTFRCSLWIILNMWAILLSTRTARTAHGLIASAIASLITPIGAGVGMKIDGETLSMNLVAAIT